MSKNLRKISSIRDFDLKDQKVFLRLDLNVPMKDEKITDDTRIREALPTIRYAIEQGAQLVLASHFGRPSQGAEDRKKFSLEPVAVRLGELMDVEVILIEEIRSDITKTLLPGLKNNQILMLENLRFDKDEVSNGHGLASFLASYIDIYINDAFGCCHRNHVSILGLPLLIKKRGVGFLIEKEVKMLDHLLFDFQNPYVAVLGGSKVKDKISVFELLLNKVDSFIVGGAMAYTFLVAQGISVGRSFVAAEEVGFAEKLLKRLQARKKKMYLPVDHRVSSSLRDIKQIKNTEEAEIPSGLMAFDIGEKTEKLFCDVVQRAKTVFWNGPMGVFETPEFSHGTYALAKSIAENSGVTVVGGGDSAAAVQKMDLASQMTHVSTGGGASLEYLQGNSLPGLRALKPIKQSDQPSEGFLI